MSNRSAASITPSDGSPADKTISQTMDCLQQDLGLSLDDIAGALRVDRPLMQQWLDERVSPPREVYQRLTALIELQQRLREFFKTPQDGADWLHDSSRYLGWTTPAEAIRAGHTDRARAALEVLAAGMFI